MSRASRNVYATLAPGAAARWFPMVPGAGKPHAWSARPELGAEGAWECSGVTVDERLFQKIGYTMTDEETDNLIDAWRKADPEIDAAFKRFEQEVVRLVVAWLEGKSPQELEELMGGEAPRPGGAFRHIGHSFS